MPNVDPQAAGILILFLVAVIGAIGAVFKILQKQIEWQGSQIDLVKKENLELTQKVLDLQDKVFGITAERDEWKLQVSSLQLKMAQITDENTVLKQDNAKLRAKIESMQTEIDELKRNEAMK